MLARLKILDDKFKSIEQKSSKKQSQSFHKLEESIAKKFQEIVNAFNGR